ncbi:MAG: hypothetical protein JXB47_21285 [Anaerolineae bacterium]|nr:hypothetical protein [Anaerolineae bacterium]
MSVQVGTVQCALAVNPRKTPAGQNFEALLLVQNTLDCDVDVGVRLLLPPQDRAGNKGTFFTKTDKILLGLEPAEVGAVILPLASLPTTATSAKKGFVLRSLAEAPDDDSADYQIGVELRVKRKGRGDVVRHADNPAPFDPSGTDMNEKLLKRLAHLKTLAYTAEEKRGCLVAGFAVTAPTGPSLGLDLRPGWESLWTKRDHIDETMVVREMEAEALALLPHLRRETVFKPLLQQVQTSFRNAGYPLQTGEAVFATKLLVMVLEQGSSLGPGMPTPRWYVRLCRLLYTKDPSVRNRERLVARLLWRDLLNDAVILGFNMVSIIAHQPLDVFLSNVTGRRVKQTEAEPLVSGYAQQLVKALSHPEPAAEPLLTFTDAYVPLVLGGVVANTRITMPGESALDSMHLFKRCRDQRMGEVDAANKHVFEMVDVLVERGFDQLA